MPLLPPLEELEVVVVECEVLELLEDVDEELEVVELDTIVLPTITDTVASSLLATYTLLFIGSTARPDGRPPTVTLATTWLLAPLITDTVFDPEFATKR